MNSIYFGQEMLSEFRLAVIPFGDKEITAPLLQKAVTANENLKSMGYTLPPDDLVRLAASPALDDFWEHFQMLTGRVAAIPMYPDFPIQVMEISRARFRFDQMIHYFSTYGLEALTGMQIPRGWLPDAEETEKTVSDRRLLEARVIRLVSEEEQYLLCAKKILEKRERVTDKERRLLRTAIPMIPADDLAGLKIPFKENLMTVFYEIFRNDKNPQRFAQLHALCSHSGDVLKCMDYTLTRECYHFRTSQKRLLTKLLESYPAVDFRTNLILSGKKGDRNKLLLDFISFGSLARSAEHKKAAADLRNGSLHSWESQAKYLLDFDKANALDFIAGHPGNMVRMLAWLIRLGYPAETLEHYLLEKAEGLNPQTLITILTKFGKETEEEEWTVEEQQKQYEREQVFRIVKDLLENYLEKKATVLDGKKVYPAPDICDPEHSVLKFNDRSEEGGYVRSGLAYRIPDGVNRLRFFIYWNDEKRVDCDLHASAVDEEGEMIRIGWNSDYCSGGLVHSGDITHSDAAEYIDVDMEKFRGKISLNVNLYSGYDSFGEIRECFCGMMAVESIGRDIKLYNAENCFFQHFLTGKARILQYGFVDTVNRCLVFVGSEPDDSNRRSHTSLIAPEKWYARTRNPYSAFSLKTFLDMLFAARKVVIADDPESADLILVTGKPSSDREISLIDNNFFL